MINPKVAVTLAFLGLATLTLAIDSAYLVREACKDLKPGDEFVMNSHFPKLQGPVRHNCPRRNN